MTRRGAYAKGIAKREEILTTALDVVAAHGYRRASVRELAEAVGLSAAGLLHYFDSKEELFTAILRKRDEHDQQTYGSEDADIDMLLTVIRHNATVPGLVQLYAQLAVEAVDPEHPAHAFFRERTEALQEQFRAAVVRAQEDGEIRADLDPAWVATSVQALSDGLQSLWLLDPGIDMAAHIEKFLDALRPGEGAAA
ncbi:TetR/AcrR family transcriptional regulator [Microbacterium sp. CIAB417]|uniref:TetR/AcrR family transcriptional regulator n=1 Tax=Microbacterium sp. CIAB417 TaxID=2860287 RepID=UPI001FAC9A89|nr:TetR/AcrR family transcriptional regulator [Microbacterium sp. CIAB417]